MKLPLELVLSSQADPTLERNLRAAKDSVRELTRDANEAGSVLRLVQAGNKASVLSEDDVANAQARHTAATERLTAAQKQLSIALRDAEQSSAGGGVNLERTTQKWDALGFALARTQGRFARSVEHTASALAKGDLQGAFGGLQSAALAADLGINKLGGSLLKFGAIGGVAVAVGLVAAGLNAYENQQKALGDRLQEETKQLQATASAWHKYATAAVDAKKQIDGVASGSTFAAFGGRDRTGVTAGDDATGIAQAKASLAELDGIADGLKHISEQAKNPGSRLEIAGGYATAQGGGETAQTFQVTPQTQALALSVIPGYQLGEPLTAAQAQQLQDHIADARKQPEGLLKSATEAQEADKSLDRLSLSMERTSGVAGLVGGSQDPDEIARYRAGLAGKISGYQSELSKAGLGTDRASLLGVVGSPDSSDRQVKIANEVLALQKQQVDLAKAEGDLRIKGLDEQLALQKSVGKVETEKEISVRQQQLAIAKQNNDLAEQVRLNTQLAALHKQTFADQIQAIETRTEYAKLSGATSKPTRNSLGELVPGGQGFTPDDQAKATAQELAIARKSGDDSLILKYLGKSVNEQTEKGKRSFSDVVDPQRRAYNELKADPDTTAAQAVAANQRVVKSIETWQAANRVLLQQLPDLRKHVEDVLSTARAEGKHDSKLGRVENLEKLKQQIQDIEGNAVTKRDQAKAIEQSIALVQDQQTKGLLNQKDAAAQLLGLRKQQAAVEREQTLAEVKQKNNIADLKQGNNSTRLQELVTEKNRGEDGPAGRDEEIKRLQEDELRHKLDLVDREYKAEVDLYHNTSLAAAEANEKKKAIQDDYLAKVRATMRAAEDAEDKKAPKGVGMTPLGNFKLDDFGEGFGRLLGGDRIGSFGDNLAGDSLGKMGEHFHGFSSVNDAKLPGNLQAVMNERRSFDAAQHASSQAPPIVVHIDGTQLVQNGGQAGAQFGAGLEGILRERNLYHGSAPAATETWG